MEIKKNVPTLFISTLGKFTITLNDNIIGSQDNQSKKTWHLLEYLIIFRDRQIPVNELMDLIWSNEDSSNPAGALKTLMFRVRKLLEPLGYPTQRLILNRNGSYAWNPDLNTVVDADNFEAMCSQALHTDTPEDEALRLGLEAIELYKGDFLPKSEYESWVIAASACYHSLYQKLVHKTIDLLEKRERYQDIIDLCQTAITIETFDQELHYKLIYMLYKIGDQTSAVNHYTRTVNLFYNEFAITPTQRFKELYKIIHDTCHGINTDLSLVQEELSEQSNYPGAFYCEYIVFKNIYQLERRVIQRTGDSILVCVLTLNSVSGGLPKSALLSRYMADFNTAIGTSLRKGDVYTRYSLTQFLILLPTTNYENGEMVLKRIIRAFKSQAVRKNVAIFYSLQEIPPAE